ncbi:hypothetical protein C0J52_01894 [Blattella germanica]|nr:hypothetical protein C0J52_01894 [Blattella germanica]
MTSNDLEWNSQNSGGSCVGCWQELPESMLPIRPMCEVSSNTPHPLPSPIKTNKKKSQCQVCTSCRSFSTTNITETSHSTSYGRHSTCFAASFTEPVVSFI